MDVVIVGGSAAGLFAGLLLARAGHQVRVLERDCLQLAPDVESAAAAAFRPSAPQIVQPHIVMARCRQLLIERLPDVYAGLLAAGVAEAPLRTQMPDSLSDTAAWPGDERLTAMMTRRSTVDWVLHRAAVAEPRVTVRYGVKVTGLLTAAGRPGGRAPHVTGVRTDHGEVPADLVIDATGRRSAIDDWLTQIGARATATWRAECGIAYFSRHYRVRPGAGLPAPLVTRVVVALDEFPANGAATTAPCSWWWRRWPPTTGSGQPGTRRCSPPSCGQSPPTRRRHSIHAGNAPAARHRTAGRPAHPRAAPHRSGQVETSTGNRPSGADPAAA